ncbi:AMP-binding protein [Pseudonocardia pini]|uniref:AMP-binding protein n=1 Tax=Pseudonocardia pini TaxID=2758030 RepID=UPI001C6887B9|nr:AMP-binding protein [Pseudonocardia pini]
MAEDALSYEAGPGEPPVLDITVGDLLRRSVAAAPERHAIVEGCADREARRRWTYTELLRDAEACARALLARYEVGSHIGIWAPNVPEWTILQCGAALAGMVIVTINPTFRPAEVRFSLEQSGAVACFAHPEFRGSPLLETARTLAAELPALRDVVSLGDLPAFLAEADPSTPLPEVDPASAAQIQYTSGTTGTPKGAVIPHRGVVNDPRQAAVRAGGRDGAVWLAILPMFHVGGCVLAGMGVMSLAGTLVPLENFDAGLALRLIEEERVTITNPVPTMVAAMMQHPTFTTRDLSSLRSLVSGGAPVPADMVRSFEKALGVDFTIVFGQTETSGVITMTTADDTAEDKATTCGRPLPGVEITIVDPATGDTVPRGIRGELLTRGYHTMLGYLNLPEASAATLEPDGWLHTGDLASMDDRGYIAVNGRIKDMIIRGGENLYPREIEDELFRHPALAGAAVIGLPDDYYGEIVAAFVRVREGAAVTPTELVEFLRPRLSGYKIPARWYLVDEYPQTLSGKIQKFALRERWESGAYVEAR